LASWPGSRSGQICYRTRPGRTGRALGFHEPIFYKLADTIADAYGDAFPNVRTHVERVRKNLKDEEESFNRTLDRGIELFEQVADSIATHKLTIVSLCAKQESVFQADEAFKLYDTYCFPLDLTEVMARERGLTVEAEGFEKLMNEQRERTRADYAEMGGQSGDQASLVFANPSFAVRGQNRLFSRG
jgi:alanyl-tRNA synthetase